MNYRQVITIEPGKRGGRPCIRRMRIAVEDVLGWLAAGMSHQEIIGDYPELTEDDILACLAYAADRERRLVHAASKPIGWPVRRPLNISASQGPPSPTSRGARLPG